MKRIAIALATVLIITGCSADGSAAPSTASAASTAANSSAPATGADPTDESPTATPGEPTAEGSDMEPMPTWRAAEGPVTWVCSGSANNVNYEFTLPTDESHEAIKRMETVRTRGGIKKKPSYILVKIDAKHAADNNNGVYKIAWATVEETSGDSMSAEELVGEWQKDLLGDEKDRAVYNESIDLYNYLITTGPNRGAKGFELQVFDGAITSMVAPAVMPSIFDGAPCEKKT